MNDNLEHTNDCLYAHVRQKLLQKINTIRRYNWKFSDLISYNQVEINKFLLKKRFIERRNKAKLIDLWIMDSLLDLRKVRLKLS